MKNFCLLQQNYSLYILNNNAMNNVIPARGVNAFSPDLVGITLFVPQLPPKAQYTCKS